MIRLIQNINGPRNLTINSNIDQPKIYQSQLNQNDKTSAWTNHVPKLFVPINQKIILQCFTSKYYGNLQITWSKYKGQNGNQELWKELVYAQSETNNVDGNLRKIQKLDLKYTHSNDESQIFKCQAKSSYGYKISQMVSINTLKSPSKPQIKLLQSPVSLGMKVTIECVSTGGQPIPSLKLYRDDKLVTGIISMKFNSVILQYFFTATKDMNRDKYSCYLESPYRFHSNQASSDLVLKISYLPTNLYLSTPQVYHNSGSISEFVCITDESYPAVDIKWQLIQCNSSDTPVVLITNQHSSLLPIARDQPNCQHNYLTGSNMVKAGSLKGSFIVESRVKIHLSQQHNKNLLKCFVVVPNEMTGLQTELTNGILVRSYRLNVTYGPIFPADLLREYVVREGDSLSVTIDTVANPSNIHYKWLTNGNAIRQSQAQRIYGNTLTIIRSDANMMHNYTIIASNSIGSASFTFRINVTFSPRIIGPDQQSIVMKNQSKSMKLLCAAQANPNGVQTRVQWHWLDREHIQRLLKYNYNHPSSSIDRSAWINCLNDQWTQSTIESNPKYITTCVSKNGIDIISTLTIFNPKITDIGRYKCIVNNSIAFSATKLFQIQIPLAPKMVNSRRLQFSAGPAGGQAFVLCWIFGEPAPAVTWQRESTNLSLIEGAKFNFQMRKLSSASHSSSISLYVAQLTVSAIITEDYRNYYCQARNKYGSATSKVELIPPTKPDVPYNIHVLMKTHQQISLKWSQGFNGGSQQTFKVSWSPLDQLSVDSASDFIAGKMDQEDLEYIIQNLKPSTKYKINICSKNMIFKQCHYAAPLIVKTFDSTGQSSLSKSQTIDTINTNDQSSVSSNDTLVITITSVSVFLFVIIVINILLVIICIRKRQAKQRHSNHINSQCSKLNSSLGYVQCSTMEMYPTLANSIHHTNNNHKSISNHNGANSSTLEMSGNNSQRSIDSLKNMKANPDMECSFEKIVWNHAIPGRCESSESGSGGAGTSSRAIPLDLLPHRTAPLLRTSPSSKFVNPSNDCFFAQPNSHQQHTATTREFYIDSNPLSTNENSRGKWWPANSPTSNVSIGNQFYRRTPSTTIAQSNC